MHSPIGPRTKVRSHDISQFVRRDRLLCATLGANSTGASGMVCFRVGKSTYAFGWQGMGKFDS